MCARDDGPRRSGGGEDNVGGAERLDHRVPRDGLPADLGSEGLSMRVCAAGDDDIPYALAAQVLRGQRADLTGANHEDVTPLEAAEDLARKGDGRETHRHRPFAQRRFGPHALADAERPAEDVAQHRPDAALVRRRLERVLHLAENLGFADDQGIEPGRDAKQVSDRGAVFQREQVRLKCLPRHVMVVAEKRHQLVPRQGGIGARHVNFRSVARGEHHGLGHRRARGNRLHRGAKVPAGEIQTLPQVDGRRPVAYAEKEEIHVSKMCDSSSRSN